MTKQEQIKRIEGELTSLRKVADYYRGTGEDDKRWTVEDKMSALIIKRDRLKGE